MHPRAAEVEALAPYRLHVSFRDGTEGIVDCGELVHRWPTGVFASLRDNTLFGQVRVNREFGVIEWPNGADIDPDTLYEWAHRSRDP